MIFVVHSEIDLIPSVRAEVLQGKSIGTKRLGMKQYCARASPIGEEYELARCRGVCSSEPVLQ